MIPLRDINPVSRPPVMTYGLVGVNVAVWLYQISLWLGSGAAGMELLIADYGVVPQTLLSGRVDSFITPLTSMFMHGGWMHVIGNMWFLWVFGDNVEDAMGRARYLAFYIACGLAAVIAQVVIDPGSTVPMVGASGAIAGVLGAYVVLYPRARVLTLVPIFILIQFIELPAFLFIFVWFGMQLLSGYASLGQLGQNLGGHSVLCAYRRLRLRRCVGVRISAQDPKRGNPFRRRSAAPPRRHYYRH